MNNTNNNILLFYSNNIYNEEIVDFSKINKDTKESLKEFTDERFSDDALIRLSLSLPSAKKLYSTIRNELNRYSLLTLKKTNSFDNYYYKRKLVMRIRVYYDFLLIMFNLDKKNVAFEDYSTLKEYTFDDFKETRVYTEFKENNMFLYKYLFGLIVKKYKLIRTNKKGSTFNINNEVIDYEEGLLKNSQEFLEKLGFKDKILPKATLKESSVLPDKIAMNAVMPVVGKIYKRPVVHEITAGECSVAFKDKYTITLDLIKKVGLALEKVNYLKVVETGGVKCPMEIVANEYTLNAIKLILITGGNLFKKIGRAHV